MMHQTDAGLSPENTLPTLLRLRSLASGSETFACRQKAKLSLPSDGFQGITQHRFDAQFGLPLVKKSPLGYNGLNIMKNFKHLDDITSVMPILSQISMWGGVSDEQREEIFKYLEIGVFKKGEYVFQKGDQPSHIYIVKKGKIGLYISDEETNIEKKTLSVGECFGVASLMAMQTHTSTAVALEDSEIMLLSRQALLELQHMDMELFALLMMNISRELARRLKLTDDILFCQVREQKKG